MKTLAKYHASNHSVTGEKNIYKYTLASRAR